jgi:hypothetical protein
MVGGMQALWSRFFKGAVPVLDQDLLIGGDRRSGVLAGRFFYRQRLN